MDLRASIFIAVAIAGPLCSAQQARYTERWTHTFGGTDNDWVTGDHGASKSVYVTFRPVDFHHFDRVELDLRGHMHVRGAAFSCLRFKWADMVLI